ncbi:hypothetical protein CR513_35466, partial [Mucuna pruriens]
MFGVLILWGPFPISNGYSYILLAIDYVLRWVEVIATKTNDAKVVVDFLKSNIFCRMGWCTELLQHITPRQMAKLKYSIGKSKRFCKRWPIPTGKTGADSLRTLD